MRSLTSVKPFPVPDTRSIFPYPESETSTIKRLPSCFDESFTQAVLDELFETIPTSRLFNLFPAGGESGTIKKYYSGDKPYVFAKTGTLKHVHNLSGYIVCRSGKVLVFSFMHNNFVGSSTSYKKEMEKVLVMIREAY